MLFYPENAFMRYDAVISIPTGKLGIKICNNKFTHLVFLSPKAKLVNNNSPLIVDLKKQLQQYFSDPCFKFHLPIELCGTELQVKIWRGLQKISAGKTKTYKDLAQKFHTSPRVIGNACRRNPLPLIIPCHRVVATSGIGGFCGNIKGPWLKLKQTLLQHESVLK